jgi:hypothetical protein
MRCQKFGSRKIIEKIPKLEVFSRKVMRLISERFLPSNVDAIAV